MNVCTVLNLIFEGRCDGVCITGLHHIGRVARGSLPGVPTWAVYLPDGRERAGANLASGDFVLAYEARTGRTLLRRQLDGSEIRAPLY